LPRRWGSGWISCRSRCRRSIAAPTTCSASKTALDGLQDSLGQVDELAKRTAWQYDNLKQSRQDLETLRKEIQDFYKSHAAAVQLRDRLGADSRGARGVPRTHHHVQRGVPELDARMDGITSKLAIC